MRSKHFKLSRQIGANSKGIVIILKFVISVRATTVITCPERQNSWLYRWMNVLAKQ